MHSPDLNIIHSPEAARMLQMVTKDFYATSYYGLWLFEVIGREWDKVREWTQGLRDEVLPHTSTWSIAIWEWVYGIETDERLPLDVRRQRILAKIVGTKPINPEVIRQSLIALTGADVEVTDFVAPYRFEVLIHPRDKPFLYNSIWKHLREIKPSHLGFEALIETKVDITIEIGTAWNLIGFGLTGQYNTGTNPNINTRAELRDMAIDILPTAIPAVFKPTPTGTKPQPNIRFTQDTLIVTPDIGAVPFKTPYPMTGETLETGMHPNAQYIGEVGDTSLCANITGIGGIFRPPRAGTQPQSAELFAQQGVDIGAEITALGAKIKYDIAGTKPQTNEKFTVSEDGIIPTIETESYKITFRMCGTGVTHE